MSCSYPNNFVPNPSRLWSRFENNCDICSTGQCGEYGELAMRRKAEILQYNQNNKNTLTKSQRWSKISTNNSLLRKKSFATQSPIYTNPNTSTYPTSNNTIVVNCSTNNCAPSTASDVPGPIVTLCYDKNVPLYMYPTRRYTYASGGSKFPLFFN